MVIATPPIRQQFEALLRRYPDRRFELIDGEIVENMPTPLHAVIAYLLSGHFFVFLRDHPLGWLLIEARCLISDDPDNDRVPDLSFVRRREGRVIPHDDPLPFAPDLVIEIQSPGQSDKFMLDKAQFYLRHGS
jgi:Uma2 family endonuclease